MTDNAPFWMKSFGYLVSTLSVLLLGFVAWDGASEKPVLMICLLVGMMSSVVGMFLRWLSYRDDHKDKQGAAGQLARPN